MPLSPDAILALIDGAAAGGSGLVATPDAL
jgi:hypothetical protein